MGHEDPSHSLRIENPLRCSLTWADLREARLPHAEMIGKPSDDWVRTPIVGIKPVGSLLRVAAA